MDKNTIEMLVEMATDYRNEILSNPRLIEDLEASIGGQVGHEVPPINAIYGIMQSDIGDTALMHDWGIRNTNLKAINIAKCVGVAMFFMDIMEEDELIELAERDMMVEEFEGRECPEY